ncbi:hypothetical protein BS78_03G114300 [Paspalum vaginatum]|nr:hypothetical protein BS78_03G114300 [Paspalum vaginatum]
MIPTFTPLGKPSVDLVCHSLVHCLRGCQPHFFPLRRQVLLILIRMLRLGRHHLRRQRTRRGDAAPRALSPRRSSRASMTSTSSNLLDGVLRNLDAPPSLDGSNNSVSGVLALDLCADAASARPFRQPPQRRAPVLRRHASGPLPALQRLHGRSPR